LHIRPITFCVVASRSGFWWRPRARVEINRPGRPRALVDLLPLDICRLNAGLWVKAEAIAAVAAYYGGWYWGVHITPPRPVLWASMAVPRFGLSGGSEIRARTQPRICAPDGRRQVAAFHSSEDQPKQERRDRPQDFDEHVAAAAGQGVMFLEGVHEAYGCRLRGARQPHPGGTQREIRSAASQKGPKVSGTPGRTRRPTRMARNNRGEPRRPAWVNLLNLRLRFAYGSGTDI